MQRLRSLPAATSQRDGPETGSEPEADRRRGLPLAASQEALRALRNFLVALSAKDCSVLLCFVRAGSAGERGAVRSDGDSDDGGIVRVELSGAEYLCRVAVVDTDIRPVSRIPKYYAEEKKILAAAAAAAAVLLPQQQQ